MNQAVEPWESGNPYDLFMGRWSRVVAGVFLTWLAAPAYQRWLDVGSGTGILSSTILDLTAPAEVLAVDLSETFIAFARQARPDTALRLEVGDARSLPAETGHFDRVVSGLALNFVPEPELALAEMVRATRPGGVVAVYVWDYADDMQMLRYFWDAATALDPSAAVLDEGGRFPLCQPAPLEALFRQAGLERIEVQAIDVPMVFKDFENYWLPFLGGQGPAPGYVMSLTPERRQLLADRLQVTLPVGPDGSIALMARAWAARGVVVPPA